MATFHPDLEDSRNSYSVSADGDRATRFSRIRGFKNGVPLATRFFAANTMLINAGQGYGSAYPSNPSIFVSNIELTFAHGTDGQIDTDTIDCVVSYAARTGAGEPDDTQPPTYEVTNTLQPVTTFRDVNGVQIIVEHTYIPDDPDAQGPFEPTRIPVEVEYLEPSVIIRVSRLETAAPTVKARKHVGTVNLTPVFDDPARSWLCTRIDGTFAPGTLGNAWQVVYEFQRKYRTVIGLPSSAQDEFGVENWDPVVAAIDSSTGLPAKDLIYGQGIKKVVVYQATEFRDLNL